MRLTHIWRHPIKSHGAEQISEVTLEPGKTMPWDRTWAVAHDAATADGTEWAPCANFSRGAKAPSLMAIGARLHPDGNTLTLSHPDRPDLTFAPDTEADAFLDWVRPLMPADRAQSARLVRVPGRGMTDTPFPSLSLLNAASNGDVSGKLGQNLSMRRWRGNLWIEGLAPWQEFDLLGKTLRIGDVTLKAEERITRCLATTANPDTGLRDADTLGALNSNWNHQDFGIYLTVTSGGTLRTGDMIEVVA